MNNIAIIIYVHLRDRTYSTKSTRYIRLLVITGLVICDFYCTLLLVSCPKQVQHSPKGEFLLCRCPFGREWLAVSFKQRRQVWFLDPEVAR